MTRELRVTDLYEGGRFEGLAEPIITRRLIHGQVQYVRSHVVLVFCQQCKKYRRINYESLDIKDVEHGRVCAKCALENINERQRSKKTKVTIE